MKNFIFYTPDGYTTDSESNEIENLQILGFSEGIDPQDAFEKFKEENYLLLDYAFNEVISQEILDKKTYFTLKNN